MDTLIGLIFLALYILCIRYCYGVAKQFGWNKTIAVLVGLAFPFGGMLIYQHYKHYAKKQKTAANDPTPTLPA